MLKNYCKIAWHNLLKDRQFTFLNLVGLSTGLACALLIYLWVHDELRFDKFHKNDSRLFQVMENRPNAAGIQTSPETPALLGETLTGMMPEIEYAVVSTPPSWFTSVAVSVGDDNIKSAGIFAGKDYFNVFSYQLIQGNSNQVLADKNSIVISEKLAKSLFHTTDNIIGKPIRWQIDHFEKYGVVAGVFKETPANSSVQFDFVLSFDAFKEMMSMGGNMAPQGPFYTYLVLKKDANVAHFNTKLSTFMSSYFKGPSRDLFLKPYADNYLYGKYENGVQAGGRIWYVQLFSLIAIFILIIACINFMNLYTAKAAGRMKEMGIRKSIGASRKALIFQYLGEAMLMTFLALIIALVLVVLFLPTFNNITGKHLTTPFNINLLTAFFIITFITGLIGGSYPAFYLSGFNPVAVLKGKITRSAGELWTRKGLVVFQFTMSAMFIVAVLVVYRQIAYVQSRNLGYDKDHVIYFESEGKVPENMTTFLAEIRKLPGVVNASSMVGNVLGAPSVGIPWQHDGQDETILFRPFQINYGMIETLGIQMAAGRTFSGDFGTDSSKIIFNETAIKTMGIKDPVGKIIRLGGVSRQIIGVAKDFHFQSLHEEVKPLFFRIDQLNSTVMVSIKGAMQQQAIDRLRAFYKTYNPGFSFDYKFLDEDYQAQYQSEKQVAVLSKYFAGLAVLISCLGLFGLAAFTAERRRKEIGIRKVLGATVSHVVIMLSKEFLQSVLIAILIATPLAWWIMTGWLQHYAYHIPMGADIFLLTGGAMILLTLVTISFQAIKAAMANPVKSLSNE
ncbi:ABC transporter permease [Chitinophaga sp. MM2321]|uniref:ABC transporter permease n=1 Tax=Chitinophaga sp. MM2321 TaxID=3137178 RepID=UPI0032D5A3C7